MWSVEIEKLKIVTKSRPGVSFIDCNCCLFNPACPLRHIYCIIPINILKDKALPRSSLEIDMDVIIDLYRLTNNPPAPPTDRRTDGWMDRGT